MLLENASCFVLDENIMKEYLEQILEIEIETSNLLGADRYGLPWTRENFLSERDGKWDFSTVVVYSGQVQAFLISSRWLSNLHGHRMAMRVDLDKKTKVSLQNILYKKQRQIVKQYGLRMTTAMVPAENESTIRYYLKEGWSELDRTELEDFIRGRNMDCSVEEPNILVDNVPEVGHPSRAKVLKYIA